jgi:hypothetical protein
MVHTPGTLVVQTLCFWALPFVVLADVPPGSNALVVESRFVHLRSGTTREWSDFPERSQGSDHEARFRATRNEQESTLRLRQQDVKQGWRVLLNAKPLGDLVRDENEMLLCFPIPAGALLDGENVLRIEPHSRNDRTSDDIRVGELRIDPRAVREVLNEGTVEIHVTDADQGQPLPCRLTIVDGDGVLQTAGAVSNEQLAVRPGTIYAARGVANFGLPAGQYTIYAGRGFEYSLAREELTVVRGKVHKKNLSIRREVSTEGYVACDTHVHTLTHSGHGDATIVERMITVAGEGIELPIATDHNKHIDYEPHARQLDLRQHFTPVIGNEVTTSVGHYNVFPVQAGARLPDHRKTDWGEIADEIFQTPGVRVAILNHARDLHSGVRPFGPKLHNAVIGENVRGWPLRFKAMEVINSGAVQTDDLQLFHDWMGLLNRGHMITPVASSDSHDVARHFVGQGRTYIRCGDDDPGKIDVDTAVTSFLQGRVLVSYGLLAELTVSGRYRSGDLVPLPGEPLPGEPSPEQVALELRVLGPAWTQANQVQLYSNGELVREETLPAERDVRLPHGVHWRATWRIPRPRHDVHLVALATGPGIRGSYWKTAKPYQPTSPDWAPRVLGCSGAVWLDGDGDGRRSTARDYAERLIASAKGDVARLIESLASFDAATAAQASHLFRTAGGSLESTAFHAASQDAPPAIQAGIRSYLRAWRDSELAQVQP